ncbi:hypothetical protein GCK32_020136 [Trichostrongylus colubriformis]|uniref:Prolyl 4-hydroxylase alpha subunit Fe(2+) 2OG dioxygenase domain-containing protein n=1 Tax=Trichostrongylus colubriformis TaxID=6319 RepID=A0AAN8FMF4_TRICO
MLQPPTSGGGTTFPLLNITVMPSIGDVVFWTNMNIYQGLNGKSLHGGCPVWEGEKVIATLWIRSYDQELLETMTSKGHMDIAKLIDPNLVHHE